MISLFSVYFIFIRFFQSRKKHGNEPEKYTYQAIVVEIRIPYQISAIQKLIGAINLTTAGFSWCFDAIVKRQTAVIYQALVRTLKFITHMICSNGATNKNAVVYCIKHFLLNFLTTNDNKPKERQCNNGF